MRNEYIIKSIKDGFWQNNRTNKSKGLTDAVYSRKIDKKFQILRKIIIIKFVNLPQN